MRKMEGLRAALLVTQVIVLLTAESKTMSKTRNESVNMKHLRSYYKAGVVEFAVNDSYKETWSLPEAMEKMISNLRGYEMMLRTAHQEGVQIIVFPEDAIAG